MAAIRMVRSGWNVGGAVRRTGEVVSIDDEAADYLVAGGHADRVTEVQVEVPVTIVVDDVPERAVADIAPEVAGRVSHRPDQNVPVAVILAGITQDDLEGYLGTALDDGQAAAVLNAASAACRSYTGQLLDYVANDVVTLDVDPINEGRNRDYMYIRGGEVILPQTPVVSVSQVLLALGWQQSTTPLVQDVDFTLYLPDGRIRVFQHGWGERVTVTYSHGFQVIPDDVKHGAVVPYAARMLSNPSGLAGRTRGTVIDTYAPMSASFLQNEQEILDAYRVLVVA